MFPFIIVLRETIVLLGFLNIITRIHIDWKKVSTLTYHFTRKYNFNINSQLWFKVILRWGKSDNIVTMICRTTIINSTIITFDNYQRHVHHITIKNSSINLFLLFFICPIIKKIIIIQLLLHPRIWEHLKLYAQPYLGSLNSSLIFEYQERDNIVVKSWQLHGILLIEKMPGPNFGSDRYSWFIRIRLLPYGDGFLLIIFNDGKRFFFVSFSYLFD